MFTSGSVMTSGSLMTWSAVVSGDAETEPPSIVPELPVMARLDPCMGQDACPWLDNYIAFSRKWSPRSFDGFHEAVGLWVLSTIAARRVQVHFGKPRFPMLYIALCARTSIDAKSTAADIGKHTLQAAGLEWLLASDDSTPQKFILDLTATLPPNYDRVSPEEKARIEKRLALTAQRGWYYEEFGQHLAAMLRKDGVYADFRGILRKWDDCPERYEYATVKHGCATVIDPYLSLLANLTPADMKSVAGRGNTLWGDGFLARFALVAPSIEAPRNDRFPRGERAIPPELCEPLRAWHERLGIPSVQIDDVLDDQGEPTGRKEVTVGPLPVTTLDLSPHVYDAFYNYLDAVQELTRNSDNEDLDGNYTRFAEKALRIATLFASLSGETTLERKHWARAQEITERWRHGLHYLYARIDAPEQSEAAQDEQRVVNYIQKHGGKTKRGIQQGVSGLGIDEISSIVEKLVKNGILSRTKAGKTEMFDYSKEEV